jgi:hypothetical protein
VLKRQVRVGAHYVVRWHDGSLTVVRIDGESRYGGYDATRVKTGRAIRIKSAAKLRYEVERNGEGKWRGVTATTHHREGRRVNATVIAPIILGAIILVSFVLIALLGSSGRGF